MQLKGRVEKWTDESPAAGDEPVGLYNKYKVEKADGSPVDPEAQYLVLRIDTDDAARAAAHVYANLIEPSMPQLAADIHAWAVHYDKEYLRQRGVEYDGKN